MDTGKKDWIGAYAPFILAAGFVIIGAGMGLLAHEQSQKIFFPMHVRVTTGVSGLNVTPSLEFGSVPLGGMSRKTVFVTNFFDSPKRISFYARGQIAPWVSVSENRVLAMPKQDFNESVYVVIPKDAAPGDYYGTLEIAYG